MFRKNLHYLNNETFNKKKSLPIYVEYTLVNTAENGLFYILTIAK
jgi:hypothetical protein